MPPRTTLSSTGGPSGEIVVGGRYAPGSSCGPAHEGLSGAGPHAAGHLNQDPTAQHRSVPHLYFQEDLYSRCF